MRASERSSAISSSTMARCIGEEWSPAFGYIVTLGGRGCARGSLKGVSALQAGGRSGGRVETRANVRSKCDTALTDGNSYRAVTTVTGRRQLQGPGASGRPRVFEFSNSESGSRRNFDLAFFDG